MHAGDWYNVYMLLLEPVHKSVVLLLHGFQGTP